VKQGCTLELSVLTWNLYMGTDLTPLVTASPNQIPKTVTEVFRQFLSTNFPVRVKAIAREIASKKPDLIGLQEAEEWKLITPDFQTVTYDFVHLLLTELSKRGLHYRVAASNRNSVSQLPDSQGNFVRLVDRDVILIKEGKPLHVIRRQQENFQTNLIVQLAGQPFEFLRGWSSVDVEVDGRIFRMINTHLEFVDHKIRDAQAKELLDGPANTRLPVIVTGDLNSSPGESSTQKFIKAGFHDVWSEVRKEPGFTCCQVADLSNHVPALSSRIDYILFKNGWVPVQADLVGEKQLDRVANGLWPSDHAGVSSAFVLKPPRLINVVPSTSG
jgi:endonuclease/exonuclease/phosphatase family metal-dependent hydrolase